MKSAIQVKKFENYFHKNKNIQNLAYATVKKKLKKLNYEKFEYFNVYPKK